MLVQKMTVLNHLSEAIKNKEITVHLQPKVDLRNGEIQSIEALARWISQNWVLFHQQSLFQ